MFCNTNTNNFSKLFCNRIYEMCNCHKTPDTKLFLNNCVYQGVSKKDRNRFWNRTYQDFTYPPWQIFQDNRLKIHNRYTMILFSFIGIDLEQLYQINDIRQHNYRITILFLTQLMLCLLILYMNECLRNFPMEISFSLRVFVRNS